MRGPLQISDLRSGLCKSTQVDYNSAVRQFLHRTKRATLEGALVGHITGQTRPKTALERPGLEPIVRLGNDGQVITAEAEKARHTEALSYLRTLRASPKKRGRPAAPVCDFLVAGLPTFGDREAWRQWIPDAPNMPREELHRCQGEVAGVFFGDVTRWIARCAGPHSRIAIADIHQDEVAPHLQLMLVAADGTGRAGWNRIGRGFVGENAPPLNSRQFLGAVQDKFYADIGQPFGLERGDTDGARGRSPIDREMGAAGRLAEEEQEATRAQATLAEREAAINRHAGLEAEVEELKTKRDTWAKERAEWKSAAAGVHDKPEELGDYQVPLSPARLATLVVDSWQHGWPKTLRRTAKQYNDWRLEQGKELEAVTGRLEKTAAERDDARGLVAPLKASVERLTQIGLGWQQRAQTAERTVGVYREHVRKTDRGPESVDRVVMLDRLLDAEKRGRRYRCEDRRHPDPIAEDHRRRGCRRRGDEVRGRARRQDEGPPGGGGGTADAE